jgi:hypothetical protein
MNSPSEIAHRALTTATAVAALTLANLLLAAETAPPAASAAAPRIGLALSGGGARGIAHIGVLKVLEEMRRCDPRDGRFAQTLQHPARAICDASRDPDHR